MRPLEAVTFENVDFTLQGERKNARMWRTSGGDGLYLYYFPVRPNIGADIDSEDALRRFYRSASSASGLGLISVDRLVLEGCRAIQTIFKTPQQPTGMTYIGSITFPFRDFSYMIKAQYPEEGTTGIREAIVLDAMLAEGQINLDGSKDGSIPGWMQDPYDATINAPLMRNRAEDERYDAQFPTHPLSRARIILRQVQTSVRFAPQVKNAPAFVYAEPPPKKAWWQKR